MATRRSEIRIRRHPDEVWAVINDAGRISDWFPLVETSSVEDSRRSLLLQGGARVEEDISRDEALRRFQYSIVGGDVPVDYHLGTVDVHDLDGESLVVYSTEVLPDELGDVLGPAVADALSELRRQLER
ncbi:SRPBCC family protein [Variovorax sp. Sphag1AA]|uniref:SRPBCC family protein n=1 Tax=Variovorax sp. Sphag1AA TaxID=2587027 RepID=UPI00160955BB|nr:SRPBCC family protein [Variovorax sp. Sphag1AA]MBB3178802.1 uncharacterized protein YndB with AHSA1/START domain [Variovorax sp. Sphag1AA]